MMKRILVFLALGVSIAPAAFANSDFMNYRPCLAQTGESAPCQLEQAVGASQCDIQKNLVEFTAETAAQSAGQAGSAQLR